MRDANAKPAFLSPARVEVWGMLTFRINSCNSVLHEPICEHMTCSKSGHLNGVSTLSLLGWSPGWLHAGFMRGICLGYQLIVGLLLEKPRNHLVIPSAVKQYAWRSWTENTTSLSNHTFCCQCLQAETIASTRSSPSVLFCCRPLLCPWACPFALSYLIVQHRKVHCGPKDLANNVKINVINVCVHVYNTNQIQSPLLHQEDEYNWVAVLTVDNGSPWDRLKALLWDKDLGNGPTLITLNIQTKVATSLMCLQFLSDTS